MRLCALVLASAGLALLGAPGEAAAKPQAKPEAAPPLAVSPLALSKTKPASKAERERAGHMDLLSQAAFWSDEVSKDLTDLEAARQLTDILRRIGKPDRAAELANQALGYHPADKILLLTAGRALIEAGQPMQAIPALQRAAQLDPKDWRAPSALGVALDSIGKRQDAQQAYSIALALKPGDAGILSNLGLSTALSGDLKSAEGLLRQAAAAPGADAQVRQNLAVVIAMQGRFDEAGVLARKDLPADVAAENIDYVRSMMGTGRRWDSLKSGLGLKTGG